VIEETQVVVHEGDEPHIIAHLLDADILAGEHGAEIDLAFQAPGVAASLGLYTTGPTWATAPET
jgi:hypothetical protein